MQRDVAPGIHRVEDAFVNFYLVEGDGGAITVVDAGHPRSWGVLRAALGELGRGLDDVAALVLTHAHFDHVGFAERARRELGVPVWVHERDRSLSRHPWHHESEHSKLRQARYPKALVVLTAMLARGARWTPGVTDVRGFADEAELDVPGRPTPVFTPGHTHGHVALHFPDRDAVVVGDALVTMNPYTGQTGPQIVSGAATLDSTAAIASLQRIAETEAAVLLPGHGEPWRGGAEEAVRRAREAGPS